ncbi:YicC/YloC family endoribonuclease [Salipiger sp. 1_MG-2023]|uniref:YicC/YloC family endoribonuclease n=1 Tax=Salipiger sp. 1_MG-2023 TaxID=3062665 RepID=UPI0026E3CE7E|nr:YicC/YloC family endoribonuclease [Salipiger sp. 1_MG-2023]MDO6584568.1 YicC/YloC family endoribonuclease [Salipiger sp. 1_MG-2023]
MTGFASRAGDSDGLRWSWELRGVNGKGLDLRLRLPDWIDGLEPAVRSAAAKRLTRGNVQVSLRLAGGGEDDAARLDEAALARTLDALARIEAEAARRGLALAPSNAAEIVAQRGVMATGQGARAIAPLRALLLAEFETALEDFAAMRASEGAALAAVLDGQLSQIDTLVQDAAAVVAMRRDEQRDRLRAALARVLDASDELDEARMAQELALIAVKSDVTEELDRLGAHVDAARALLAEPGAIGRKLDFLMQEFNREANTLCSKSGSTALTRIGLDLKTVIDQMREQVQNVE